jgi:hypothetical protein
MNIPKFIILEGTDNVGKSTQAKAIRSHFKDLIFHDLKYSNVPFKADKSYIKDYSRQMYKEMFHIMETFKDLDHSTIIDRSHLGESVYSPIYRDYDGDYVFDIEKKYVEYLKDNLYLVVFIGNPEKIFNRDDNLSFYTNVKEVQNEIDAFKRAFELSTIKKKILIDIKNKSIHEVTKELINFLNK